MATSYNPDKVPPPLSDSSSYQDWRKIVDLWGKFTTCAPAKQGMAVIFSLKSSDQQKVLSLPTEVICADDGLNSVLKRLDELYLEDETLELYSSLEDFESYKRSSSTLINDFLIEFELKYGKIKTHGITYPEELLGFRLLKSANLSSSDEKLAKATSDLKYPTMKLQLKRLFSEKKKLDSPSIEEINYQEEQPAETLYTKSRPPYRGRFIGRGNQTQGRGFPSQGRGFPSQGRGFQPPSRGTPMNWRYPNTPTQWRQQHPPTFKAPSNIAPQSNSNSKQQMNPLNPMGTISTCGICKSVMHWAAQCPHNTSNTYLSDMQLEQQAPQYPFDPYGEGCDQEVAPTLELECEIVLFQTDFDYPTLISGLLAESFNHAVIDCGASKTVCGKAWLHVLLETLPDSLSKLVCYGESKRVFKFGDGQRVTSEGTVSFPAVIGKFTITIEADIVDADIPLLFSKDSLKKAGMAIDFLYDTAFFLGQCLPLSVTTSGHLILPITKYALLLNQKDKPINMILSADSSSMSKEGIAKKLHRQFAHAPPEGIVKLLKSAKAPWNQDKDLFDLMTCGTCNRYCTAPPKSVVG